MKPTSQGFWKNARKWLPGVVISALALFLVFRVAKWQDLGPALASIKPVYLGIGVGLTLLFMLFRAAASCTILGNKPTFWQAFWAINQGYFLNNVLPLRAGEFGRAALLGQAVGISPMQVLSSIVIERVFDLAVAASLLLMTLPLAFGMEWAKTVSIVVLIAVIVMLGVMYLMARNKETVTAFVHKIGQRWAFVDKFIVPQVSALLEGLTALSNPGQFLLSLFWVLLSWLVAVIQYYVFILAIAPGAPFWWGAFADAVLAMGIAIPSAPAALGTFEASLVGALTILGVEETPALAMAITIHFIQFITTGILGVYSLLKQGRSFGNLFKDIRIGNNNNS